MLAFGLNCIIVIRHCLALYKIASLKGRFLLPELLFVAEQGIAPTAYGYEVKWGHWHCEGAGGRGSACICE